ncbi:hypothetical protein NYZ99_00570 [Maribacter litopenaei]|uniref:Uncharacterized protein n=1 Tax=Maribacter litopenaei TaxID=2976127 RepID=A0ABY5Y824_9FLAO|nr:hypothetical protein [Maribacter litopenaei]UWX55166.1 hypothetical protein NYZ99_00570 [Maribacter litopenaei]
MEKEIRAKKRYHFLNKAFFWSLNITPSKKEDTGGTLQFPIVTNEGNG